MLYKKSKTEELSMELFKNPTSEYRAAPFWAWNCELEKEELLRQIEELKKMGFGGFHMHTRSGMATTYLSDEFMELIKACTEKAKEEGMLAWLYDEDRWPSGFAGGYVTKIKKYRQRQIRFTIGKIDCTETAEEALENGNPYLVGIYDIVLNHKGELSSYKLIENEKEAAGTVWYAYCEVCMPAIKGWYNGQTYVDTLNKEAIDKFIQITYERYKETVGGDFGEAVPAIFTDEPQFAKKSTLPFAESKVDVTLPWTYDFDKTFKDTYGFDIIPKFPELIWEKEGGKASFARYCYHDHTCERFTTAFADNIGAWCEKNGIELTGHMLYEQSLYAQTTGIGEAMRAYRSFQIPGMDLLCNYVEFSTAKQVQSASHQYGREGAMTELYGVTGWNFDFRGHKYQGDWQAALGLTVRVPHLSWVSMKGSAKRDYPASINYQSPWYMEYPYIEDHFARLNTVLTRGKACVNVGVIHPVESYWLHYGPSENTADIRNQMDEDFQTVIRWLLLNTVDFDFICESSLPSLCKDAGNRLSVGEMQYSAVLVASCETLRNTTVEILNKFMDNGGKVIFAGEAPKYIDAKENEKIKKLYERGIKVSFNKLSILNALSDERDIEIKDNSGKTPQQFIYQLREDGKFRHLFIAKTEPAELNHYGLQTPVSARIKIKGEYTPVVLNTLTGEAEEISFDVKDGFTTVYYDFYENDSLLLRLATPSVRENRVVKEMPEIIEIKDFKHKMKLIREEDNVCLLDMAEISFDGEEKKPLEEILRADRALREELGWPVASGLDVQPWTIEKERTAHKVSLEFKINCQEKLDNIFFCTEETGLLRLNGKEIKTKPCGYFVDKAIKKYPLPKMKKGENTIVLEIPFGKRTSLENCYLTGDFDVIVEGCMKTLTKPKGTVSFGDITSQGMPFYGGNLSYVSGIEVSEDCDINVNIARYSGSLTKVYIDSKECGNIVLPPYDLKIRNIKKGKHTIEFKLFGNRHNTFGALHNCSINKWVGPDYWYTKDDTWCYEYNTKETGILKSPVITMYTNKGM